MTTQPDSTTSARPQGTGPHRQSVRLVPAAEACDLADYTQMLDDPALIAASVAVEVDGFACLAVPVGGERRGGYLSYGSSLTALAVRGLLAGRPGYPDVRVCWSLHADTFHVVEWGDTPPQGDDAERGRFYGYSATVINACQTGDTVTGVPGRAG